MLLTFKQMTGHATELYYRRKQHRNTTVFSSPERDLFLLRILLNSCKLSFSLGCGGYVKECDHTHTTSFIAGDSLSS
jgi:hypothetical protein